MLNNVSSILFQPVCVCVCGNCLQGHVFAMELSSGDEFYIACDNTGSPLAVFSNNGLLLKQVGASLASILPSSSVLLALTSFLPVHTGDVHSIRRGLL